jgi:hypothetical protein
MKINDIYLSKDQNIISLPNGAEFEFKYQEGIAQCESCAFKNESLKICKTFAPCSAEIRKDRMDGYFIQTKLPNKKINES